MDGYPGYRKLPENIRVVEYCAHAMRKFNEIVNVLSPLDQAE